MEAGPATLVAARLAGHCDDPLGARAFRGLLDGARVVAVGLLGQIDEVALAKHEQKRQEHGHGGNQGDEAQELGRERGELIHDGSGDGTEQHP